jgi:dynein heavy chain
VEFDEGFVSSN